MEIKKRGGLCLFHTSLASENRVKLLQSAISRSLLEAEEEESFANYWLSEDVRNTLDTQVSSLVKGIQDSTLTKLLLI